MRIAYLDCFSGISGDMFLGALVDAGVSPDVLQKAVAALDIGAELEIGRVDRSGISATKVDVLVDGEADAPRVEHHHNQARHHGHTHEHAHEHVHPHDAEAERAPELLKHNFPHYTGKPETADAQTEPRRGGHGRSLTEIKRIIGKAKLSGGTRKTAIRIFEALGAAEAKVHNTSIEKIHFHEVGAVDAMVDIVGAAAGAEALQVGQWICSPLNVGSGAVQCAHGRFPVPAPATVELLEGALIYSSGLDAELVTPTGAAIVKVLAGRFGPMPPLKIIGSGYGAGTRDFPGHANVLRITIGHAVAARDAASPAETVVVLEANLDDLNPQLFGYVMERALAEGALDVFGTPVQMKKGRPGMVLSILCRPDDAQKLTRLVFAETTTLGVRMREERRETLVRRSVNVRTRWGAVRMKVANLNGSVSNYAPEYEDCRRIAGEHHIPLKAVMQEATRVYLADASAPRPAKRAAPNARPKARKR